MTEQDIQNLAHQLGCPTGKEGAELGHKMHQTNLSMTLHAIKSLKLDQGEQVLEIGHGNCVHLPQILTIAEKLIYDGLDISEAMHQEAQKHNAAFVQNGQARFALYDGLTMPYDAEMFHKIMTVNTLYFWQQPLQLLKEIYRVLKPAGWFCLTFTQKVSMEKLPFTKYGFTLYDTEAVEALVSNTSFKIVGVADQEEQIESKMGALTDRRFTTITLEK